MTIDNRCPVCERPGLTPDNTHCPQCEADLTCFRALAMLHSGAMVPEPEKEKPGEDVLSKWSAMFVGGFCGVILVAALYMITVHFDARLRTVEKDLSRITFQNGMQQDARGGRLHIRALQIIEYGPDFQDLKKNTAANSADIKRIDNELKKLKERFDKRTAPDHSETGVGTKAESSRPGTIYYKIRKTDTLWSIARRFYGDGKYYPLILEENPHLFISDLSAGSDVRLMADPDPAIPAEMYSRKIERKNGMLLWKYVVQPGDTLESIHARFHPPGMYGRLFLNAGRHLIPFETVKIILQ